MRPRTEPPARPAYAALMRRTAAIVLGACVAIAGDAAADVRARFTRYAGAPAVQANARPQALDADEPVKIVVRLMSDSVAEARARTATHVLTPDEETAVVAVAHREHAAARPALEGLGGRVVAEYHHALNGVAVTIARSQAANLAALPGVRSVHRVNTYTIRNATSVPYLGAPQVWHGHPSLQGEGIKIAIIDTGIDYTHADFGGPGTVAAFQAAAATSTQPADPALFGPHAPKVKGGIDLVGDAYDATDPNSVPVPDPNPLDCNGHGSHVAGTAAGFGVANGATYRGPYSEDAYATTTFDIGPGVAPKAALYAVRVFGCTGATNVVTEAIDWAVANHMDVISMSLGAPFGTEDSADALAASNAARAGISVVAAAGNEGPAPYIASTPASGTRVLSVAAMDARRALTNGVRVTLSSGAADGLEANLLPLPGGTVPVLILRSGAGLGVGCSATEYPAGVPAGALVIVTRGSCTFAQKAALAAQAGAAAIGVVNNSAGYVDPAIPGVTIPFVELLKSDTPTFLRAGRTGSLARVNLANGAFESIAAFSSGGPRYGDGAFRPNVSAPGAGIVSTAVGTGAGAMAESGTSMATPQVAGTAALAREAHPDWHGGSIAAAIVETSDPGMLSGADPRRAGSGVIRPVGAAATQVVASDEDGNPSVSFGFEESNRDFVATRVLRVRNHGRQGLRFNVGHSPAVTATAVPHTLALGSASLWVDGGDEAELRVTLHVPVATVGASHDASGASAYRDAAGYIVLAAADSASGAPTLTIPYYLTVRARSNLSAAVSGALGPRHPSATLSLSNRDGALPATADLYAWGLASRPQGSAYIDTRAVGVQSNLAPDGSDSLLVFAVNTWTRFSSAAIAEWDVLIDVNGDGQPDYILFSGDHGNLTAGRFDGIVLVVLYNVATRTATPVFYADAPTDGSTLLMPVLASQLGLAPGSPAFSYTVRYFDLINGGAYAMPGAATFNPFAPAIGNAQFYTIAPGASGSVPVAIDPARWARTPALGLMVVSEDNAAGTPQAMLERIGR